MILSPMPNLTRRKFCGAAPLPLLAQTKPSRPNIIIFYVDELRATALKLYRGTNPTPASDSSQRASAPATSK